MVINRKKTSFYMVKLYFNNNKIITDFFNFSHQTTTGGNFITFL